MTASMTWHTLSITISHSKAIIPTITLKGFPVFSNIDPPLNCFKNELHSNPKSIKIKNKKNNSKRDRESNSEIHITR